MVADRWGSGVGVPAHRLDRHDIHTQQPHRPAADQIGSQGITDLDRQRDSLHRACAC
jgi:hypothetical protein